MTDTGKIFRRDVDVSRFDPRAILPGHNDGVSTESSAPQ